MRARRGVARESLNVAEMRAKSPAAQARSGQPQPGQDGRSIVADVASAE
jgi:hypothetical protein